MTRAANEPAAQVWQHSCGYIARYTVQQVGTLPRMPEDCPHCRQPGIWRSSFTATFSDTATLAPDDPPRHKEKGAT